MSFPCCPHCCNTLFVAVLNRTLSETWFYINLSTGAKRISNIIYPSSLPPPSLQPAVRRVMKDYEINVSAIKFNYWYSANGAHSRSLTPENLVKRPPYHATPLLPLQCISRWCKESPLTKLVNWIIAHNYGEPKCQYSRSSFSWEGKILNPTLSDITCSRIKTT